MEYEHAKLAMDIVDELYPGGADEGELWLDAATRLLDAEILAAGWSAWSAWDYEGLACYRRVGSAGAHIVWWDGSWTLRLPDHTSRGARSNEHSALTLMRADAALVRHLRASTGEDVVWAECPTCYRTHDGDCPRTFIGGREVDWKWGWSPVGDLCATDLTLLATADSGGWSVWRSDSDGPEPGDAGRRRAVLAILAHQDVTFDGVALGPWEVDKDDRQVRSWVGADYLVCDVWVGHHAVFIELPDGSDLPDIERTGDDLADQAAAVEATAEWARRLEGAETAPSPKARILGGEKKATAPFVPRFDGAMVPAERPNAKTTPDPDTADLPPFAFKRGGYEKWISQINAVGDASAIAPLRFSARKMRETEMAARRIQYAWRNLHPDDRCDGRTMAQVVADGIRGLESYQIDDLREVWLHSASLPRTERGES